MINDNYQLLLLWLLLCYYHNFELRWRVGCLKKSCFIKLVVSLLYTSVCLSRKSTLILANCAFNNRTRSNQSDFKWKLNGSNSKIIINISISINVNIIMMQFSSSRVITKQPSEPIKQTRLYVRSLQGSASPIRGLQIASTQTQIDARLSALRVSANCIALQWITNDAPKASKLQNWPGKSVDICHQLASSCILCRLVAF